MVQRVDQKTALRHGPSRAREHGGLASFDLFPSKLAIPAQRRGSLRRTPLVSRLRGSNGARYVSIAAPAGYGKTTLLAQWADEDGGRSRGCRSTTRTTTRGAPQLHRDGAERVEPIDRRVFRGVAVGGDALWSTAVPRLGAAIASLEAPVVIVLDDVHALTNASALDAVDALALHVPPGSLLVLAGREEAALPLARFRVQGELLEIGPADLALTRLAGRGAARRRGRGRLGGRGANCSTNGPRAGPQASTSLRSHCRPPRAPRLASSSPATIASSPTTCARSTSRSSSRSSSSS